MVRRRGLVAAGALMGLLLPVWAQQAGSGMRFEVVSIRRTAANAGPGAIQWGLPDGFRQKGWPLRTTIMLAYFPIASFNKNWLVNEPGWMEEERYDVEAKVSSSDVEAWQKETKSLDRPMLHEMLQQALAERCKLVAHTSMVDGSVWALATRKQTAGLKAIAPDAAPPEGATRMITGGWRIPPDPDRPQDLHLYAATMADLAAALTMFSDGTPVQDQTGLSGRFEFVVRRRAPDPGDADNPDPLPLWEVEGLGLEMKRAKGKVEMLVIDHIERPTEN